MKHKLPIGSCRFRRGAILVVVFLLLLLQQTPHAKIVFNSRRSDGRTRQLYVMDDNGRNVHRLTHSEFFDSDPRWFPDGKQILFVRDLSKGKDSLYNSKFYCFQLPPLPKAIFLLN